MEPSHACHRFHNPAGAQRRADLGHPQLRREIIVLDDASSDGTSEYLRHAALGTVRACFHPEHLGQGAARATGLAVATGEIVVVVDPTLTYDPAECGRLLAPILAGDADVVYGSRYGATTRQVPPLWERLSDQIVTVAPESRRRKGVRRRRRDPVGAAREGS